MFLDQSEKNASSVCKGPSESQPKTWQIQGPRSHMAFLCGTVSPYGVSGCDRGTGTGTDLHVWLVETRTADLLRTQRPLERG